MKNSTLKNLAIFSSALFVGASAVYLYSPTFGSHADSSQSAEINLTVGEAMSLSLDKDNLSLTAGVNSFTSGNITATVITNAQYGYTLTLEDVDASSDMTHTNSSISDVLTSTFSGAKTSAQMDNNTWGFSLNATDFYRVPVNGNPAALKRTNSPMTASSEDTIVTFGTKVGNIASGAYADSVLFTVYTNGANGNPSDGTTPTEPGYVSPCDAAAYVSNGILTDPRDGNTYTVNVLKDGKCWMTQNLRIAGETISSANSNLPEGETYTIPTSDIDVFNAVGDEAYDTSAVYVHPDYGGYYTFRVATADWGTTEQTSGNAPRDICPKGWSLPTGGNAGEFPFLYYRDYSYNLDQMKTDGGFALTGQVDVFNHVMKEVGTSGNFWSSTVYETGGLNRGRMAYVFSIYGNSASPSIEYNKYYGFSVRCVAR